MKFVLYNDDQPGILTDAGVIDIGDLCSGSGQAAIVHLISNYDDLKSQLETRAIDGTPVCGRSTACAVAPRQDTVYGRQFSRVRRAGTRTHVGIQEEPPYRSGTGRHRGAP